jgi:hypothetical protein
MRGRDHDGAPSQHHPAFGNTSGRLKSLSPPAAPGWCFCRINMPGFLSSPLVVVGKGLELTRNRLVGHGLGSAEQRPSCFQILLASL